MVQDKHRRIVWIKKLWLLKLYGNTKNYCRFEFQIVPVPKLHSVLELTAFVTQLSQFSEVMISVFFRARGAVDAGG
jgi:hypothetical protein